MSKLINKVNRYINERRISKFKNLPSATALISFPRTGSHWLRFLIEVYSDRPLLLHSFYKHKNKNYILYHSHDNELTEKWNNVIYLYRKPTDVIFSQLSYYKESTQNLDRIKYWTKLYAKHFSHWYMNNFPQNQLFVKYENLKKNPNDEFQLICDFLRLKFDVEKFESTYKKMDKAEVKKRTMHDRSAVVLSKDYQLEKERFIKKFNNIVEEYFIKYSDLIIQNRADYNNYF